MRTSSTPAATWQGPLESSLPQWLLDYLPRQRWFGGKALGIREARLHDSAWLPGGADPCALVLADVTYESGARERYSLLLGLLEDPGELPVLGRLESGGRAVSVVEAMAHPGVARTLLRGLTAPGDVPTQRGAVLRYGDVGLGSAQVLRRESLASLRLKPLGVEQSNTSIGLGRAHIFKLFRKLESGENPELEIGRFLAARTGFREMPELRGSLSYVPPSGPPATLGILQAWVESRGDGWSYMLTRLRDVMGGTASTEPLIRDMLTLGVATGEFHAALASDPGTPAFAPEPATDDDVEAWSASVRERADRALGMLERGLEGLNDEVRPLAQSLLRMKPQAATRFSAPEAADGGGFHKIRVHGDYHLGQTLKTATGFVLIDFEGEPARPLAERRAKHCALKDVAGMLRSFDYAVETVRAQSGEEHAAPPLREAFLEGYLSRTFEQGTAFLPRDRSALMAWSDFFELEKALYEIEYELNNRPAWLHIPLRGTLRVLDRKED